jgi:hypothetical protein
MKQSPSALRDEFEIVEVEEAVGGGEFEGYDQGGFVGCWDILELAVFKSDGEFLLQGGPRSAWSKCLRDGVVFVDIVVYFCNGTPLSPNQTILSV